MKTHLPVYLFTSILILLWVATGAAKSQEDRVCLSCHSMKTLAYQNPLTGGIRNLSIDPQEMIKSNHSGLSCRTCHGPGFDAYPHFDEARRERLDCLHCHQNNNDFPRELFESIEKSFHRSIHFQSMPEAFGCSSCHDPHTFYSLANTPDDAGLTALVARDNAICLGCHKQSESLENVSEKTLLKLSESHAWLPEVERHWRSVRCVECHTQGDRQRNHFILGSEYAVRTCDTCHSRDSILISKLYRYRATEERNKAGFTHSVVMNDAYIIGMTRNLWLDWGSLALITGTLLGVGGHGLARWITTRRNTHHETHH